MSQFGKEIKKLGFGFMRLPMLEDGEHTDIEQVKKMVDQFMEAGCTYFDTAYVYGKDGESEKAMRAALVERYPREKYTIATKLNAWLACDSEEEWTSTCSTPSRTTTGSAMRNGISGSTWRN